MMDKNKAAVEIFDKLAGLYEKKFMDVSLYAKSLDAFCDNILQPNAEVLEIACGPGNISNYVLEKRPGLKIFGIDLAPNMIRLAEINNPTASFQIMDCRQIDQINHIYDAVICGFCLPYLSEPEVEKLFKDISTLMNAGAVLYLSAIEDKHEHSAFKTGSTGDQIFMHFYEAGYLSRLLNENKFEIIDLVRYGSREIDPAADIDLVIIARKKTGF